MTDSNRSKDIEKALYDLRVGIPGAFQKIVDDARREADETRAWSERLDAQRASDELDRKIDELDYMMKRGAYTYLRGSESLLSQSHFPGVEGQLEKLALKICVHCGAELSPLGNCEDDCLHSRVVDFDDSDELGLREFDLVQQDIPIMLREQAE